MGSMNGEGLFGLLFVALGGTYSADGLVKYGLTNFNGLRLFFGVLVIFGLLLAIDDVRYNEKYVKGILGFFNLLEK